MKAYQSDTPRFTLGIAAIAVTAATIGLLAIAPARMDFRSEQLPMIALSDQSPQAATDSATGAVVVDSIDVYAVREPHLAPVVEPRRAQKNKLRG